MNHECLIWKFMSSNDHLTIICRSRFLKDGDMNHYVNKSSIWHGIKCYYNIFSQKSMWIIENGERIYFWKDNFLGIPLVEALHVPQSAHKLLDSKASELIGRFAWRILNAIAECNPEVVKFISFVIISRHMSLLQKKDLISDAKSFNLSFKNEVTKGVVKTCHFTPRLLYNRWIKYSSHRFNPPTTTFY